MGEKTARMHSKMAAPWEPGQSGNPAGRPKGSRNKLGEAFIEALYQSFQTHGPETIERVRTEEPAQYMKVVASLLPKEMSLSPETLDMLSDEDVLEGLAAVRALLGDRLKVKRAPKDATLQ